MAINSSSNSTYEHNLKYNNYHGVAQALADNMFRPFTGIFAIYLGATNFQVAMLSSLPAVVSALSMVPGTRLIDSARNQKRFTALLFFFNRVFFLVTAGIPILPEAYRALALVLAVGFMNLPGAISTVAWQSLIGRIIPANLRGEAFAKRNQLMAIGSFLPTIVTGYLLDYLPSPFGYQLIFSVAFVFALVEIFLFLRLKEVNESDNGRITEKLCGIREIIRDAKFSRFMFSSIVFYFGWQMAWPLFTLYEVKNLGANNTWMAVYSAIITVVSIFSYHWWGRYAAKKGNYDALILATIGMAVSPILMAISTNLWILAVYTVIMGYFTAGTVLVLFNAMLDSAPDWMRTSCVAYYNTLINISATVAPFVGSLILELTNIYVALIVAALLRGLGSLAFYLVRRKLQLNSM